MERIETRAQRIYDNCAHCVHLVLRIIYALRNFNHILISPSTLPYHSKKYTHTPALHTCRVVLLHFSNLSCMQSISI